MIFEIGFIGRFTFKGNGQGMQHAHKQAIQIFVWKSYKKRGYLEDLRTVW
jgi:hypothetical protein